MVVEGARLLRRAANDKSRDSRGTVPWSRRPQFAIADGDVVEGEKVFQRCISCHNPTENINQYGPNLKGVVGRPVASVEGFGYSNAMKAFAATGAVWDEATLDVFLKSPFNFVKGNNMRLVSPVRRDAERKDLIAFLKAHM